MKKQPNTKSAIIEEKIKEVEVLRKDYASKARSWGNSDADKWFEVQVGLVISEAYQKGRESGIQEAINEVKELEIRSDDGGDYITDDTELMRTEVIGTLEELQAVKGSQDE